MFDHIDRQQRNKLKLDNLSIPSPERHRPLRHQFSSDNMHVAPFNIPNLRIDQRKTSSAEDMARKNSTSILIYCFVLLFFLLISFIPSIHYIIIRLRSWRLVVWWFPIVTRPKLFASFECLAHTPIVRQHADDAQNPNSSIVCFVSWRYAWRRIANSATLEHWAAGASRFKYQLVATNCKCLFVLNICPQKMAESENESHHTE